MLLIERYRRRLFAATTLRVIAVGLTCVGILFLASVVRAGIPGHPLGDLAGLAFVLALAALGVSLRVSRCPACKQDPQAPDILERFLGLARQTVRGACFLCTRALE